MCVSICVRWYLCDRVLVCLYVCVYVCVDEGGAEKLRSARARVRARHAYARKSMYATSMYARYVSN